MIRVHSSSPVFETRHRRLAGIVLDRANSGGFYQLGIRKRWFGGGIGVCGAESVVTERKSGLFGELF